MTDREHCRCCGAELEKDEVALTRKMVNRGAEQFYCISCLACHYGLTEEILREKIREFKAMGCTLFQ